MGRLAFKLESIMIDFYTSHNKFYKDWIVCILVTETWNLSEILFIFVFCVSIKCCRVYTTFIAKGIIYIKYWLYEFFSSSFFFYFSFFFVLFNRICFDIERNSIWESQNQVWWICEMKVNRIYIDFGLLMKVVDNKWKQYQNHSTTSATK